jgi:sulfite exporter TauE/SafE
VPAWHAGRIVTYALLGAIAGAAGRFLPGPAWLPAAVAAGLLCWFALGLAGLVPEPRLHLPGLARAGSRAVNSTSVSAQFLFGLVNGFLPCGLVYSALGLPVALASPTQGALAMVAFGAGTTPALSLAAIGIRRLVLNSLARRRLLALLVFLSGIWVIWMRAQPGATNGHYGHQHDPAESAVPRQE